MSSSDFTDTTFAPVGERSPTCEHCGDAVTDGGSFCSDAHAAAWLESPFG